MNAILDMLPFHDKAELHRLNKEEIEEKWTRVAPNVQY